RMRANLDSSLGLVFSQKVLLSLIDSGLGRLEAYAVVQRSALRAWRERRPLRELLEADPDARKRLKGRALAACFDLDSYAPGIDAVMKREGLV
ncbi:MAG: adenylosuccinate lyase, partial [Elusimicrobiota bacterium]